MADSPEIESLRRSDDAILSDDNAAPKQYVAMILFAFMGVGALYWIWASEQVEPVNPLNNEEEFRTTTFRPPSFVRDGEQIVQPEPEPDDNVLVLPPPPPPIVAEPEVESVEFRVPPPQPPRPPRIDENVPPPPAPEVAPPPPEPVITQQNGDVVPVEPVFPERWKSASVVVDTSTQAATVDQDGDGLPDDPLVAGQDASSQFLARVSNTRDRGAQARQIDRIDAFIPEGTLIPAILETAINSDLPGQIRAITSKDVYSFDGRRVLIPTGTRLIGEYNSSVETGQSRIFIVWSRLLRDDGVTIRLNSIGADNLGRAGVTGFVDKKFRERFGAAILLSVVGGVSSFISGLGSNDIDVGSNNNNSGDAENGEQIARDTLSQTFADLANTALEDSLDIPPTIHVDQGERLFVFVRQDLDFSALYKSPLEEEIEQIRLERGIK